MGIVLGDLVFVAFAIYGLHAIAEAMGSFFAVARYAGGAYLIWLGVGLIRSRGKSSLGAADPSRSTLLASFVSGFVLTLGDVKAILFYASLFPAFVDVPSIGLGDAVAVVLITVTAVGGVKLAYAFAARKILLRFETKETREHHALDGRHCNDRHWCLHHREGITPAESELSSDRNGR